jgi:chromosome segregation ATPase
MSDTNVRSTSLNEAQILDMANQIKRQQARTRRQKKKEEQLEHARQVALEMENARKEAIEHSKKLEEEQNEFRKMKANLLISNEPSSDKYALIYQLLQHIETLDSRVRTLESRIAEFELDRMY